MIAVLIAAVLVAAPAAPARGEPGDPYIALVHVHTTSTDSRSTH